MLKQLIYFLLQIKDYNLNFHNSQMQKILNIIIIKVNIIFFTLIKQMFRDYLKLKYKIYASKIKFLNQDKMFLFLQFLQFLL